ncbi:MFS transporter [Neobacillus sp. 3P2-tot-E-2]|uniref:MFS transporter n=1 Tax=Neobacillus sp. 3P2-tot-E-2 TaxID=3132212 RepID=UPI0039A21DFA
MSWKRVLWILWVANFCTATGIGMILPFLPLYIEDLGVKDVSDIALWTGFIFSAQSFTSIIFQPLWGSLADRFGHRMMLMRAGIMGSLITILMGFAGAPWHLLVLRMTNGIFSGFIPMSISLQSLVTPQEHAGRAMGTLHTGSTAGILIGPLIGGVLAGIFGFRMVFILTGVMSLIATIIVGVYVKNDKPQKKLEKDHGTKNKGWGEMLPLVPIFVATAITTIATMSIQPIIPIYATSIYTGVHVELIAGLVISISGIGTLISSPILGRLGDHFGHRTILIVSLIMCGITFIPQVLTSSIVILLISRFFLGLFIGGMIPSLNSLIKTHAPSHMQARAHGLNSSSRSIGSLIGPLLGSLVSASLGFSYVFFITMGLLFINALFVMLNRSLKQPTVTIDKEEMSV